MSPPDTANGHPVASGNRSLQKPRADWVNVWSAAVDDNHDANSMFGREADPGVAIVSATVLVVDGADGVAQVNGPSKGVPGHRTVR